MNRLLIPAVGVVSDIFALYDPIPFGLVEEDFINYAMNQFSKRFERIEKARHASLIDVYKFMDKAIETDQA